MGSVTNALGLTRPEVQTPSMAGIDSQINQWKGIANGTQAPLAQAQYAQMANTGIGNALAGVANTKGLNPSAQATMMANTGSQMQGQAAQNAGVLGLQERQLANQNIASMLMGQGQLQNQTGIANANLESQQAKNMGGMIQGLAGAGAATGMFGKSLQTYANS